MTLDDIYTKTKACLNNGPIIIDNFKITNITKQKDMLFVKGIVFYGFKARGSFLISDKYYNKRKEQLINYLLKLDNIWND